MFTLNGIDERPKYEYIIYGIVYQSK